MFINIVQNLDFGQTQFNTSVELLGVYKTYSEALENLMNEWKAQLPKPVIDTMIQHSKNLEDVYVLRDNKGLPAHIFHILEYKESELKSD